MSGQKSQLSMKLTYRIGQVTSLHASSHSLLPLSLLKHAQPPRPPVRFTSGLQKLAVKDLGDSLASSLLGGVQQPGRHFVLVRDKLIQRVASTNIS